MINARIIDSIMEFDQNGILGVKMAFLYLNEEKKEEYIVTPNIKITTPEDIINLLKIAETSAWEGIRGKVVQIEIEDNNVVSMANIFDINMNINFLKDDINEDNKDKE